MKKTTTMLFLLILILSTCSSHLKPEDGGSSSFWKVKGVHNTVYLLGSIHVGTEEMYPLPSFIQDSFQAADYLVVELDILKSPSLMMMKGFLYPLGDNLEKHLDSQTYSDMLSLAREFGLTPFPLKKMYPWAASSTLDMLILLNAGYRSELGIDYYFLQKNDSKPVLELESVEEQIQAFQSMDEQEQLVMLKQSIYSNKNALSNMENMVTAWQKGDTQFIEKIFSSMSVNNQEQFVESILYDRNRKMSHKILEYLKDKKDYFVIVGLAHLCGTNSIVDILQTSGYTVTQY